MTVLPIEPALGQPQPGHRPAARLGAVSAPPALILVIGTLLVWSATATNDVLTAGDPTAYLHKHLVNIVIGLVLAAAVMATDHRWVRIVTPAGLRRLGRSACCSCW